MNGNPRDEAGRLIPGGVNSPVRSFRATGLPPLFVARASGKHVFSIEKKRYVDFCLSWGAVILGHADPAVRRAAVRAVRHGSSFGFCHPAEAALAWRISMQMPALEKIRFVSSGTEAVMAALRLARAFTGRQLVVKFDGCYHGHSDLLLVKAGSGLAEAPAAASSAGVNPAAVRDTLSIPFNDPAALEAVLDRHRQRIACLLLEPVPANMGLVPPRPGFLALARELTRRYGILLVFDEVITGFRVGMGGVQGREGVFPDLTTLGKVIGGGFPCAAFGGRADIMDLLAPDGPVYQAGTLSGNPVAMAAGCAVLDELATTPAVFKRMEALVDGFASRLRDRPGLSVNHYATLFSVFHTSDPVTDLASARRQDMYLFKERFRRAFEGGLLLPPSAYETCFLSARHGETDVSRLCAIF